MPGIGYACYDLPAGTFRLEGWGGNSGYLRTNDDFQLVGIPAVQPLSFRAELSHQGTIAPSFPWDGYARVLIREVGGSTASLEHRVPNDGQPQSYGSTIGIEVVRLPGETFRIEVEASAGGGSASLYAAMRFVNLPPNVQVVSCQGYVQDGPVPVRAASWGRVKSLYR